MNRNRRKMRGGAFWSLAATLLIFPVCSAQAQQCTNTVIADVVVFDTPIMFNRLGAQNPNWITYALERDVVAIEGETPGQGNAQMRKDKRIRPLVLRVNEGDCLQVNFKNWLAPQANPFVIAEPASPFLQIDDQVAGRFAGFHVRGLQLVGDIKSDASNTGKNPSSVVPPGGSAVYKYYAPPDSRGTYLADSYGATFGGEATSGNTSQGMFAAVNVEPKGARWYRSQLTEEEMRLARQVTPTRGSRLSTTKSNTRTPPPGHTKGRRASRSSICSTATGSSIRTSMRLLQGRIRTGPFLLPRTRSRVSGRETRLCTTGSKRSGNSP